MVATPAHGMNTPSYLSHIRSLPLMFLKLKSQDSIPDLHTRLRTDMASTT